MSLHSSWWLRCAVTLWVARLASACTGGGTDPNPNPTQDTTAPTTRATPAGGSFSRVVAVALACEDGSGSGCAATYYTLDGSAPGTGATQYREPFMLSATTTLRFFSVDTAGNTEAVRSEQYTFTGTQDVAAPTTTATPAGGAYNSPRSVALSCNDGTGSGCAATHYTLDGSVPTEASARYTAPLAISASTTLRFFSVDAAGNAEGTRTERYVLDTEAPTVSASPRGGSSGASRVVTLTCDDGNGSGCAAIHYTTDGSIPSEASTLYTAPITLETTTRLRFLAVDRAGNASEPGSELYTLDGTGPVSSATPRGGTYRAAFTVALACDDGTGSGCAATYFTTNGTAPTRASERFNGPISITGSTTLRFFSVDVAGNDGPVVTEAYVLDLAAPLTRAVPPGRSYAGEQFVTLECEDAAGSGCAATYYTLDGTAPTTASPLYVAPVRISSSLTLRFFSVDRAGNNESVRTEPYLIDAVPPTAAASPTGGTYTTAQQVTLTCADGTGSGCAAIHFTLDGSVPTPDSAVYTSPARLSSNTTLRFFAVDAVGNRSAVQTQVYTIDAAAPLTSASPAGGTFGDDVQVTLTCDDGPGGSGCAATRYTVDGTVPGDTSPRYEAPLTVTSSVTLRFFSVDAAGNREPVRVVSFTVDKAAPTTSPTPRGGNFTSTQTVSLACVDTGGSTCAATYLTTDGTPPTTASPRYTAPVQINATTTLRFFSVDALGNAEAAKSETYVIDSAAPITTATPAGGSYRAAQDVVLTCNDGAGVGCASIRYTTDPAAPTGSFLAYSAPLRISANTTLRFFSQDGVGNTEPVRTETYVLDTVVPTVSASPRGGAYFTPQTVTLTCSDVGSGCAAIHFTLNGATPDTNSPRYQGALTLSTNTTLAFLAVDGAGNTSPVGVETYTFSSDTTAPVTAITPPGGTYFSAQTVTLACTDNSGGSGCAGTFYTLNGAEPSTASTRYTAPFTVSTTTQVRFRSVDAAGNLEAAKSASYSISTNSASAQIAAVRGAMDGTGNLPIDGAIITFIKPGVGNLLNDPEGFFLQAERAGPALFVEANLASLFPTPEEGMRVSVTVGNKRLATGMVRVDISSFSVLSTGTPLSPLLQEVSSVDLPPVVGDFEAELISLTGTVTGAFINAGSGHVQAPLVTTGVPEGSTSAASLRLRMVESVKEPFDITPGCTVSIRSPLWLFGTTTQPSVWVPQQLTSLTCPGPRVTSAQAAGSGTVIVRFDRRLNVASVLSNGSQFSIPGLAVTGATVVTEREVWVSTSPQTVRQPYTVTVASSVRDAAGTGVPATGNSANFPGWRAPAVLRITELAPSVASNRDLVELVVLQGGSTSGMTFVDPSVNVLATLPDVEVAAGDIIMLHLNPDRVTAGVDAPGSELTSKTEYPFAQFSSNFDTAWDFQGGNTAISGGNRVFRIRDALGNTQDALAAVAPGNTAAAFPPQLQALQAEGQWLPSDCAGVLCTYTSFPTAVQVSFNWNGAFPSGGRSTTVGRVTSGDSNQLSDWAVGPSTLGIINP